MNVPLASERRPAKLSDEEIVDQRRKSPIEARKYYKFWPFAGAPARI
ncbi:MAG: hypothetical protein QM674_21050 [Burkholderiaceae bacterium]